MLPGRAILDTVNVGIFSDSDPADAEGLGGSVTAAARHAPADMRLRVYAAGSLGVDTPACLVVRSLPLPLPGGRRVFAPNPFVFLRHLRRDRIAVVHVASRGPVALVGLLLAQRLRLPVVGSAHAEVPATSIVPPIADVCGRWPLTRCRRLLVPSEQARHQLLDRGAGPERVYVWGQGVDGEMFRPERRSHGLRQLWGIEKSRQALLCVAKAVSAGESCLLAEIRDRLQLLGVHHRFVFLTDVPSRHVLSPLFPDAVFVDTVCDATTADVLASGDLLLSTSGWDGVARLALQAQASGVPIVIPGGAAAREQMVAGHTGMVCHSQQPEEWAGAIAAILRRPERLAAMRTAARAYALTRPWSDALQPLYQAYRDAAADAPASRVLPLPTPA